jgi:translation initiation factor 2 subunit 1
MRHLAEISHKSMEELCTSIAWPLYRAYGHAYDAFTLAIHDPDAVFGKLAEMGHEISADVRENLLTNIKRRLTPQPVKIRADFDMTCYTYDGIDAIKAALAKGETASTEACPVKVRRLLCSTFLPVSISCDALALRSAFPNALFCASPVSLCLQITLVAPPQYVATTLSLDRDGGIAALNQALELATQEIKARGGEVVVKVRRGQFAVGLVWLTVVVSWDGVIRVWTTALPSGSLFWSLSVPVLVLALPSSFNR